MREGVAVSPWNRSGMPASDLSARSPKIADCTLRDGEQQAGLVFRAYEKVEIAGLLDDLGVDDIEVGTPAVSDDDREAVAMIASSQPRALVSALARATKSDIDLVAQCGAKGVRISYPISERQRAAKLKVSAKDYIKTALEMTSYAKTRDLIVVFSPYDTTRCDLELLRQLLTAFAQEGSVDRVRLVDTVGGASPEAIRYLVEFMKTAGEGIPIELHCHDDLGFATANTVAGAMAGADFLSCTVNGIGERAGNAALEEVVAALAFLYDVETGVNLTKLTALSRRVSELSGIKSAPNKAVVGANAFTHETGTVVAGILRDPFTAEPYMPELVGQHRRIVVGKKSGRAAVEFRLRELGFNTAGLDVEAILGDVKSQSISRRRALTDPELVSIATRHREPAP